jgi:hypothetical protein
LRRYPFCQQTLRSGNLGKKFATIEINSEQLEHKHRGYQVDSGGFVDRVWCGLSVFRDEEWLLRQRSLPWQWFGALALVLIVDRALSQLGNPVLGVVK